MLPRTRLLPLYSYIIYTHYLAMNFKNFRLLLLALTANLLLTACSMMETDLSGCPTGLYVGFKYDYNVERASFSSRRAIRKKPSQTSSPMLKSRARSSWAWPSTRRRAMPPPFASVRKSARWA